jgi:hypothetical protein
MCGGFFGEILHLHGEFAEIFAVEQVAFCRRLP